ncbi:uncharacterized protein LOC119476042 [Sebastes umbrosus]|uniref:uncharacterized protein LOC119476042 n=1 Tax=Sebastes umbrosus TaxID=72105 RepID=UPI0018A0ED39|nr:uncharacterized protein LOC119476042 [Sebastes umbrosus]
MSEMSGISEKDWKRALTSILEELGRSQYRKMLELLETIPECQKSGSVKEKMPGIIIQYYGLKESISAINDLMQDIPRNDEKIQNLLRPFVAKLKDEQEKETQGKKRKREEKDEVLKPPFKVLDQQESCTPDKEPNTDVFQSRNRPWKKSICDVKTSGVLETEGISVKVVQKSGLRTYQTKEKVKRFFFYVAVADETGTIKLMVYGKDRDKEIKEDSSYLLRNLIKDDNVFKVTTRSNVSETKSVDVSEELQMEARKLIYPESPIYSVENVKPSADKTVVSVEGTVTEINPVKKIKVEHKRQKIERQDFKLKDDTDSIWICMWDEGATQQCEGLSVGDVIKVSNLRTNLYCGTTTLNSTGFTKIDTVQSVGIQNVRIEIMGIMKANKKETQLEAEVNQRVHTFVAASRLLAKAFGFKLDGGFKDRLLDKIPLSADAEIQGNQIKKITAALKM